MDASQSTVRRRSRERAPGGPERRRVSFRRPWRSMCHPCGMPHPMTTAGLMRSLGLDVDGPVRWGSSPASQSPGVFVVETDSPLAQAPIDLAAVRRWLERVPDLRLDGERPTPNLLANRLASFWVPGRACSTWVAPARAWPVAWQPSTAPSWGIAVRTPVDTGSRRCGTCRGCASGGPRPRRTRSTRTPSWEPSPRDSPRACRFAPGTGVRRCPGPTWVLLPTPLPRPA